MMIQNQADAVEKGKTRKLDYFGTRLVLSLTGGLLVF